MPSHRLKNSVYLLIAAGFLISALPVASQTLSFTVSTSQPWTDTGLDLQMGQTLAITASAAAGGCDPLGVSGATGGNLPIPNQLPGALVARLQGNGPAWFIGAKQQLQVQESGHLWLGVNATGDPPCKGAFAVKVTLGSGSAAAGSAAGTGAAATPSGGTAAAAAGAKTPAGAGSTTAAPDDQVKDVKGALETAAQTWLSGQLGVGGATTGATSSSATGNGDAKGVPALSIPADKISKAPLDGQLRKDIDGLPRRVNDQFQHQGDMVNFVIVGNQAKVADALTAADWHIADRDVKESVLKAALETYEKKAYLTMPMSELYLYGRVQDFGYEQAEPYAVVASRHHFRIWKAPFQWNGQDVWVGAGTHDIGFEKDQRNGSVTHKIDPAVDGERDNIGATLEKSGKVKTLTYYLPPSPVQDARNATGGGYHSDGRILVITLN
jgi:LssY C-terminus